ncbi:hypothetical protein [Nostoc sp.]|uniref:hypothetical protein n=1 Tax=Nostoc sp. TaxID=1180 RepID=UPI002FF96408
MKDYAPFPTTVRENVAFGNLPKMQDDAAITEAIAEAGLARVIEMQSTCSTHFSQGLS